MKVVSFISAASGRRDRSDPKALWLMAIARAPRAPPEMDDLVLELDVAYSASSIDLPDEADQPQETIYVDIDTFLEF